MGVHRYCIALLALAACTEPVAPPQHAPGTDPRFGKASAQTSSDTPLKMSFADAAGHSIGSDGLTSGTDPAWQYIHGECGVSSVFNLGDALLDPQKDYKRGMSCSKRSITIRYSGFVEGSGSRVAAANSAATHMNADQVETVISPDGTLRGVGFHPNTKGCDRLWFYPDRAESAGSDWVVVKRVDASTWTIETQAPDPVTGQARDVAACLTLAKGNKLQATGLYHMPFKVTLTVR